MAKKAVATLRDKSAGKGMVKVIKMTKSSKTGAYTFAEDVVAVDAAKDFFAQK